MWSSDSNGTPQALYKQDLFDLGIQSEFWVGPVPPTGTREVGCGWPNPVRQGRPVTVPASSVVYDVRGRRVARADAYGVLDTTSLSAGLYLARPATDDAATCQFVVRGR